MSVWTAEYQGTTKTLAEWGLGQARRRQQSQEMDTFEFGAPSLPVDEDPVFAPGSSVTIRRDGVTEFVGTVRRIPLFATGRIEGQSYQLANAWADLDELVYQQEWFLQVDPENPQESLVGGLQSRVVLFQGVNGSKISLGGQIADVVAYAASCGVAIQLAAGVETSLPVTPPFEEALDMTCGEAIRKALRWAPDAVTWFDYTTSPPTLHVGRRQALPAVEVPLQGPPLAALSMNPRYDLLAPGVVIKFERVHTVDGASWREVIRDVVPAGANERVPGTLVATIDLEGSSVTHSSATIVVRPFLPATTPWWRDRDPTLRDPNVTVTRLDSQYVLTGEDGVEMGPARPEGGTAWQQWTGELVKGQIAPWMLGAGKVAVSAQVHTECDYAYARQSPEVVPTYKAMHHQPLSARVTLTNLTSGTYKTVESSSAAEEVPVGIAQQLWEAVGTLHYEGSMSLVSEEPSGPTVGQRLHITGGRPEWATAGALIQAVEDDIETGTRTVTFGPPTHLGPADLIELLRFNRNRRPAVGYGARITGQASGGGDTPLGEVTANHDSGMGHSGVPSVLSVAEAGGEPGGVPALNTTRSVEINPEHLVQQEMTRSNAAFHRFAVVTEGGVIRDMVILCQPLGVLGTFGGG